MYRRVKELGDFQTPIELAIECAEVLSRFKLAYGRILEPTCGRGSFLLAATEVFEQPLDLLGVEIQPDHAEEARRLISQSARADVTWRVHVGDIFDYNLKNLEWNSTGPLLILGNPPWVTSSDLGAMDAVNVPEKSNFRSMRGIEALTGESNFDVAEYIWIRLLLELRSSNPTIAMLSKTSVARRILGIAAQLGLPVAESMMWRIDAKAAFDAAVDACFFAIRLEKSEANYHCQVFESLHTREPATTMGIVNGTLVADVTSHAASQRFDGTSPVEWRQGIKHDLTAVMELRESIDHVLYNGLDEAVQIEPEWVYPLLKGSDVNSGRKPSKKVIVTQRSLSDSPQSLQYTAPLLWRYLQSHSDRFSARKSSIYSNRSVFAMFGVGTYTFTSWKVAVSGLYKIPRFQLVGPINGRPVLLDDTCYFLPCSTIGDAAVIFCTLNSNTVARLLRSLMFVDAKRPVTKKLLQRIDLRQVLTDNRDDIAARTLDVLSDYYESPLLQQVQVTIDNMLAEWSDNEPLSLFSGVTYNKSAADHLVEA